jgi:hypothetical protein
LWHRIKGRKRIMVGMQHVVLLGALGLLAFLPSGAADNMSPRAPSEPRVLHFPADRSLGRLMIHPTAPQPLAVAHEWADYDEREEYFSQAAIRHLFDALPELKYIQTGLVWPGERILREKVLAASYTTRPGVR